MISWPWIGAFLDGEGHLSYRNNAVVYFSQGGGEIGRILLRKIKDFIESHGFRTSAILESNRNNKLSNRPCYRLSIAGTNKERCRFLSVILPHLNSYKKQLAEDAIRFEKLYPSLANKGTLISVGIRKAQQERGTWQKKGVRPWHYIAARTRWNKHKETLCQTN